MVKKIISLTVALVLLITCCLSTISAVGNNGDGVEPIKLELPRGFRPISLFSNGSCFVSDGREVGLMSTNGVYRKLGSYDYLNEKVTVGKVLDNNTSFAKLPSEQVYLSISKDGSIYQGSYKMTNGKYYIDGIGTGNYGIANEYGKLIIPTKYDFILPFANDGYFPVAKRVNGVKLWTYLKEDGTLLGDYKFTDAKNFVGDLALVSYIDEETNKPVYAYLKHDGSIAFKTQYDVASSFYNNYAFGIKNTKKYTGDIIWKDLSIYDREGKTIDYPSQLTSYEYPSISDELVAIDTIYDIKAPNIFLRKHEFILFNTKTGKFIDEHKYQSVLRMSEDLIRVQNSDNKYGFIDSDGKQVIPCIYSEATKFSNGVAAVADDSGLYGYVDKTGKVIIPFKFTKAGFFCDELAPVANDQGLYGYIDKTGKFIVDYKYDHAGEFTNGLAEFKENEKVGIINNNGEIIVPAEYGSVILEGPDNYPIILEDDYTNSSEDMLKSKPQSINPDGSKIIDEKYDVFLCLGDGMFYCENANSEQRFFYNFNTSDSGKKIDNVKKLIDALPEQLTEEKLDQINAVITAYEELNYEEQQALFSDEKLRDAQKYLILKDIDKYKEGDIDSDGKVTVSDITTLRSLIMDDITKTVWHEVFSDVDKDGAATISDIVALRKIIME